MNDLFNDIKERVKDRISDPFLSTFILSFMAINWKFFFVFIKSGENNIDFSINQATESLTFLNCFLYPFLIASIYVFIYPLFRVFIIYIQILYKNLESKVRKLEYVKPAEVNHIQSKLMERESKIKEHLLQTYKYFLLERQDDNFSYQLEKYDPSIEINEIYAQEMGVFRKPIKYESSSGLCYIIDSIRNEYIICAHLPSFIPLPTRLKSSAENEYYITIDGLINKIKNDEKNTIYISKINDKKAYIGYFKKNEMNN